MAATNVPKFLDIIADIPGWYYPEGLAMNEFFLDQNFPEYEGMSNGDIAEIGVYEGRSAVHLAYHLRAGETLHLFDPYEKIPVVAEMVGKHAAPGTSVIGRRTFSQLIDWSMVPDRSVRFLRIDGNHVRRAMHHDLDVAHRIVTEAGIVNLDDVFDPMFAGMTYGMFEWLTEHRGAFELILVGFTQGYLCRPSFIAHYMQQMRALPDYLRTAGVSDFSLVRASGPSDCVTVGITKRRYDRDWLMSETDYSDTDGPGGRRLEY